MSSGVMHAGSHAASRTTTPDRSVTLPIPRGPYVCTCCRMESSPMSAEFSTSRYAQSCMSPYRLVCLSVLSEHVNVASSMASFRSKYVQLYCENVPLAHAAQLASVPSFPSLQIAHSVALACV